MEIGAYARIVLDRWRTIVALVVVAAGVAYGTSLRAPVAYRATASLSVTPSIVEYWTGQAVERLLNNYALQIRSRPFAATVARDAGLAPGTLDGRLKAVAAPTEFRVSIEIDDPDPEEAARLANAAGAAFVTKIRAEIAGKERQDIRLEVLEPATRPDAPVGPNPGRAAAGGGLAGAIIGVALATLLAVWDGRVHTVVDASRIWGVPTLGAIPPVAAGGQTASAPTPRSPSPYRPVLTQPHPTPSGGAAYGK
jgi:capsular polysaccharide biosynthesis protein